MTSVKYRDPPSGEETLLVRCLTAAHNDLAAIDTLDVVDDDGRQELLASAARWWWQASDLAQADGDHDLGRVLACRGRVLGLRATHDWDADDEAWMLDELERLLDFEEAVGVALSGYVGSAVIIDVVGAMTALHTARREAADAIDTIAAAGAVGA
jgi:hypothetical protein